MQVFWYEFCGTFILVLAMNLTSQSVLVIICSLFLTLILNEPITGSHYNPATSLGVFIHRMRKGYHPHNMLQLGIMVAA